jgi:hypothetical protein
MVRPNIQPGEPRTRRSTRLRTKDGSGPGPGRVVAGSRSVPLSISRKAVPWERTRRRAAPAETPCQLIAGAGPSQGNRARGRGRVVRGRGTAARGSPPSALHVESRSTAPPWNDALPGVDTHISSGLRCTLRVRNCESWHLAPRESAPDTADWILIAWKLIAAGSMHTAHPPRTANRFRVPSRPSAYWEPLG